MTSRILFQQHIILRPYALLHCLPSGNVLQQPLRINLVYALPSRIRHAGQPGRRRAIHPILRAERNGCAASGSSDHLR